MSPLNCLEMPMRKLDENQNGRGRCGLGSPKRRKRPLIQIKSLAPNREALLAYKYFFCLTNAISDRLIFHLISRDHLESEEKPRVVPKTRDGRLLHMLTAWPPKSHRSQTLNRGFVRVCKKNMKIEIWVKKTQPRDSSIKHIAFRDASYSPGPDHMVLTFHFLKHMLIRGS